MRKLELLQRLLLVLMLVILLLQPLLVMTQVMLLWELNKLGIQVTGAPGSAYSALTGFPDDVTA